METHTSEHIGNGVLKNGVNGMSLQNGSEGRCVMTDETKRPDASLIKAGTDAHPPTPAAIAAGLDNILLPPGRDVESEALGRVDIAQGAIAAMPARTWADVLAQLVVAGGYGHVQTTGIPKPDVRKRSGECIEAAVRSCIDFIRSETGAVLPTGLAHFAMGYKQEDAGQVGKAPGDTEERPDAALLDTMDQLETLRREMDTGQHNDPPGDISKEAFNAETALMDKIIAMPACTMAGLRVKLEEAWSSCTPPGWKEGDPLQYDHEKML